TGRGSSASGRGGRRSFRPISPSCGISCAAAGTAARSAGDGSVPDTPAPALGAARWLPYEPALFLLGLGTCAALVSRAGAGHALVGETVAVTLAYGGAAAGLRRREQELA